MSNRHYSPLSVTVVTAELTWLVTSLAGLVVLDRPWPGLPLPLNEFVEQLLLAFGVYLAGFYYSGLYDFSELQTRREVMTAAVRGFSAVAVIFGAIFLWTRWVTFHAATLQVHLLLTMALAVLLRLYVDEILNRYGVLTRIAIVGTGAEARGLAEEMLRRREHGHEVTCFVSADGAPGTVEFRTPNPGARTVPVISAAALLDYVDQYRVKRILVATADLGGRLPVEELLRCKSAGHSVEDGHTFYERLLGRIFTAHLSPQWLIFSDGFARSAGTRAAKRTVDLVSAACLLVLSAPLCLLVAGLIKLGDGGPILFGQVRGGRQGVPFTLWKFRSMRVDAEAETGAMWAEENDPRVTGVGRWLRAWRIDEIPQAWNVLRGDMSFVGPRPERPEFVARLRAAIPYYDYRHGVRPGITGWAQVNRPYGATVEDARDKLEYDLYYLKNFSVLMDVFILLRTIKIIMFGWGSR